MSSHPVVRRLTAAALLLMFAAAPALAAPAPRPHTPRVPVVTGVPLLDQLLDWLGFPAAVDPTGGRGAHEKSSTGLPTGLNGVPELIHATEQERGGMIDPNG